MCLFASPPRYGALPQNMPQHPQPHPQVQPQIQPALYYPPNPHTVLRIFVRYESGIEAQVSQVQYQSQQQQHDHNNNNHYHHETENTYIAYLNLVTELPVPEGKKPAMVVLFLARDTTRIRALRALYENVARQGHSANEGAGE